MASFMYVGSDGIYPMDGSAANQNITNAYNQSTTSTTYGALSSAGLGILGGGIYGGYQSQLGQMAQNVFPGVSSLQEMIEKASKPVKKKFKGVLVYLRSEIDGWHGDVLERCPV